MKILRYLLLGLALVLIIIQFVPNELPAVEMNNPSDLLATDQVDGEVANLLKAACYDCHSNSTNYPWYSHVAPISWLVAKDTREGRKEVNFSNWSDYDMMDQLKILDDVYSEVEEEHMPLPIYITMHSEADLTPEQRQKIMAWAESTMDIIAEEE